MQELLTDPWLDESNPHHPSKGKSRRSRALGYDEEPVMEATMAALAIGEDGASAEGEDDGIAEGYSWFGPLPVEVIKDLRLSSSMKERGGTDLPSSPTTTAGPALAEAEAPPDAGPEQAAVPPPPPPAPAVGRQEV
jgi:hypothetical protein